MSLEDRLYPLLAVYDRLPQGLRRALGWGYRQLPASVRRGARYPEFKRLAEEGEGWPASELIAYQLKELRRTLHHAAAYCPYYEREFARAGFRPESLQTFEDLRRCPLIEKRTVIDHRDDMASRQIPASQRLYITTGGSTGIPVGFYLHKGVSRAKEQAFWDVQWGRIGYKDGARLALIRGQVTSAKAAGRIIHYDATRDWLMLSSYHLTPERLPEYLEAIERFKPDFIHAYPSAALQLAEYLVKAGQEWRTPLRGILCGSERISLPQKRLLEATFKCRSFGWYGHSERIVLAGEGATSELLYFNPQYGFAEFGPPDAEGLREVIGTSFHNMAMPLIRYRTGDYVRLVAGSPEYAGQSASAVESLEYPWPAAVEVAGREQEFLVSGTGRKISLTAFNMHNSIFDHLYAVQLYQEERGRAEFRYVPGPQFHTSRLAEIESGIRQKLGDDFAITFRQVEEVEKTSRGKHKWLVSKLDEAGK